MSFGGAIIVLLVAGAVGVTIRLYWNRARARKLPDAPSRPIPQATSGNGFTYHDVQDGWIRVVNLYHDEFGGKKKRIGERWLESVNAKTLIPYRYQHIESNEAHKYEVDPVHYGYIVKASCAPMARYAQQYGNYDVDAYLRNFHLRLIRLDRDPIDELYRVPTNRSRRELHRELRALGHTQF